MSSGPFSPWSAGSETQLGQHYAASDISGDRVFPIRSVISVDPPPSRGSTSVDGYFPRMSDPDSRGAHAHRSSDPRQEQADPLPNSHVASGQLSQASRRRGMSGPFSSIQADAARQGTVASLHLDISMSDREYEEPGPQEGEQTAPASPGVGRSSASAASADQSLADVPHVTTRFTHVQTEEGHAIITGHHGVLQRCDDEPIHAPGAVQGFGVLVAIREESEGSFVVRYASENSGKILGYSPIQLFKLKNFMDILTEEQQDNLLDHIDFIRDEDADPAINGPEVLGLSIRVPEKKRSARLWCAIHINPAHPDLIICEFELDHDQEHPPRPADELTPDTPHDTLHANPTLEEIEESTEIVSKPLRVLRSARKRRGEQGAMQVFDIMSQVQEQLASAPDLDTFLKILVGIVKELTGFHRVMIYQFDSSFNGKVVTELVDTSQTIDLYRGLHFPASDIPRQARELYKVNKVRLLYDRDLETARIVCRTQEDLDVPLDMTHAYLRAMSPIHLKYLAHMAVRSSMSISMTAFGELWGLIACHTYGPHGMRVSFPIRKMCRLVGDTASRNIERLSYASRLQARKLINSAPTDKNPAGYIIASSEDLLKLFDVDFGLLSIKGETKILGTMEQSQEALAMLEYLRMRKLTSVLASQDVNEDFPDLRYPPGFQVLAGLLYVPLSVGGNDFIVFFRRGQVKEVRWAGNPYEKTIRHGTAGYLEPRSSFKTWSETVVGKSREWNEEQVETAAVLCLVYGKFIEVWRSKEEALESSKLTRLLLANSAHEVRTPLNAIINYLEIALEGSLDQETRENLARSHSASKSLIYVINDLLDLTKTEQGQDLIKDEIFDLSVCLREATDPFHVDAKRKGIEYLVTEHPGLPQFVHGDGRRIRQAISNVTANAITHTDSGSVHVEMFVSDVKERQAIVDIVVEDSGVGMSPQQLDALFRDLEQVSSEDPEPSASPDEQGSPNKTRNLGLGLAVVARIVRNMDGQLRLKSEVGQGSRFVVQLPLQLPDESPGSGGGGSVQEASQISVSSNPVSSAPASLNAAPEGEILLIDRGIATNVTHEGGRPDGEKGCCPNRVSVDSAGSSHGSRQSDADRPINANQMPLSLDDNQPGGYSMARQDSKGSSSQAPSQTSAGGAALSASTRPRKFALSSPIRSRDEPGTAEVRDSKTPVRGIEVPEDFQDMPSRPQPGEQSRILFERQSESGRRLSPSKSVASSRATDGSSLRTLIAEDDPINMKILRKRLDRAGHEVHHAVNGEDCAALYKENPSTFDVILMDMQVSRHDRLSCNSSQELTESEMPIVDGLTSTKMIRSMEKSLALKGHSGLWAMNGRVPIFAVSASLEEKKKQTYIDAGFDAWILKPIDFKRLNTLLTGIHDTETRNACLYAPGHWERGGWFATRDGSDEGSEDVEVEATAQRRSVDTDQLHH
ncbi:Phytochrome-like protein cph1 [Tolypocladium capitatum]|uniref:Phytochrome-like protein cph1 n=1 Tax=Tolypocladium capitatum TaxID=45235 RepID=A0A2K3QKK3_9HYPO|nr:Phytochrome-like protein cph1 [Tolypocladium capitatum]